MHAVELIAQALGRGKNELDTETGICCLLGKKCECVRRDSVLTSSFTNWDLLKSPSSKLISVDAYIALTHKWERMSSWWCDGNVFELLDRQGVRRKVFEPLPGNKWCAYATTSYKKHGALWSTVCTKKRVWRFENLNVDLTDDVKVHDMWDKLNVILRAGFPRQALQTLQASTFIIQKVGYIQYANFMKWAQPICQTSLYQFLVYLLPSQEELKMEQGDKDATKQAEMADKDKDATVQKGRRVCKKNSGRGVEQSSLLSLLE